MVGGIGLSNMTAKLILPFPPILNTYWRMVVVKGVPRVLLSAAGRAYKTECGWMARSQGATPQKGNLVVRMELYRPRKAGDIDAYMKGLFDGLNGVAWIDDSQVVELHAYRRDDKTNPRVEVTIEQAP